MDPVTAYALSSTISSIGSSLLGHSADKKRAEANAASALAAYGFNVRDLGARGIQAQEAAAQDRFVLGQQGAAAEATAATSAAESGVSGSSVLALLNQYSAETSFAQGSVDQSLVNTKAQLRRSKGAAFVDYQNRLAGVPQPNLAATGLEIGTKAFTGLLPLTSGGPR